MRDIWSSSGLLCLPPHSQALRYIGGRCLHQRQDQPQHFLAAPRVGAVGKYRLLLPWGIRLALLGLIFRLLKNIMWLQSPGATNPAGLLVRVYLPSDVSSVLWVS